MRRNNDELVANWGNLVNRMLTSVFRSFGERSDPRPPLRDADGALLEAVEAGFDTVGRLIEETRFRAALGEAMQLATRVNQYVSEQAPWAALETDRAAGGYDPPRRAPVHRQPQGAVHPVPPV